ncbi:AAA family ATPase [Butyrivibrio sp. WCD3002]|uniref:AAA family ATPase n=1 Tax=Butyrivibrio sp. WCD3002 TaxID=1280676 RepID=UPI00040B7BD2|nr:AAA family ATPase [Butyrivibrio sp. WCD3002]
MNQDLLGNIYNDFFGPGSGGDGKPPVFDDPNKEKEIIERVEKDFKNEKDSSDDNGSVLSFGDAGKSAPDKVTDKNQDILAGEKRHIQDADEALREARALFNSTHFTKNITEGNDTGVLTPQGGQAPQNGEAQVQMANSAPAEQKPAEPETDPMDDLNALIGLASIKHDVKELTDFAKVQKLRKDEGMKSVPVSLHLVFTGNPGTGKTTVARIISRIYKQIGVLSKGQLVEVDRSGLVAGYVGQTALKTQEKINEALGGVLFIDEAYSLSQENDAFGQEAIDTILKAMEDHRDDLVVIVAGYTAPMEKFINSNPGLKSRFNKYIEFPDYSVDELEAIFNMNCKKYEYEVEEDTQKHIREMITARKLERTENFANAREVRNLFEEIVTNQARRIAEIESPTADDIRLIKSEDLMEKSEDETKKKEEAAVESTENKEAAETTDETVQTEVSEKTAADTESESDSSEAEDAQNEEAALDSSELEDVLSEESADDADGGAQEEDHQDGGDSGLATE